MVHHVATDDGAKNDYQAYDDEHESSPEVREWRSGVSVHAGAARWLAIHDELLSGLAHALSNRVATIDAAGYMLQFESVNASDQAAVLRGEVERLETLVYAFRGLPRRLGAVAEAVMPNDAVHAALTLHAHHNELRDIPCTVSVEHEVPPVFVDPTALQHALLVALTAARTAAGTGGTADLQVRTASDAVEFTVAARDALHGAADHGTADAEAIRWLLADYHCECMPHAAGGAFRVPTLAAARRNGR